MTKTEVLRVLDRAEANFRYGRHLIVAALMDLHVAPPSRPRAIGLMACEHVEAAVRGLVLAHRGDPVSA